MSLLYFPPQKPAARYCVGLCHGVCADHLVTILIIQHRWKTPSNGSKNRGNYPTYLFRGMHPQDKECIGFAQVR